MVHLVLSLMAAAMQPYLLTLASKGGAFSARDNHQTRVWQASLESGWRRRAYWAHQNAFESFPIFAAAAIVAFLATRGGDTLTNVLMWAYPGARAAYSVFYLTDHASLRSTTWFLAMACIVALFVRALLF